MPTWSRYSVIRCTVGCCAGLPLSVFLFGFDWLYGRCIMCPEKCPEILKISGPEKIFSSCPGLVLTVKKRQKWTLSNSCDFRPPYLRNDTDCLNLTTKIALYGMSSFHFYCWNQSNVIPLACTVWKWRWRASTSKNTPLRRPYHTTSQHCCIMLNCDDIIWNLK